MTCLIASLLKPRISNFKSIINVGPTGPYLFIVMGYFPHPYSHAHDLFVEPWSDFSLDPPLLKVSDFSLQTSITQKYKKFQGLDAKLSDLRPRLL